MPIVYFGDDERVTRELAEAKDALDSEYRKVLGKSRAQRVKDVSDRLLNKASFYSDLSKLREDTGYELHRPNKFLLASNKKFEIDKSGRLKERKINTAPLFYISEEGFQNSGSAEFTDKRLVSYIHEFNHYIWYVLQRVPVYIVSMGIAENLHPGSAYPDFDKIIRRLYQKNAPRNEWLEKIGLISYEVVLQDIYEKANKLLDRRICKSIGVDIDIPWRGKKKEYRMAPVPYANAGIVMPVSGDPFYNLDDKEVIERFIRWEEFGQFTYEREYMQNFVNSVKELRVSRLPFSQLAEITAKRKQKKWR